MRWHGGGSDDVGCGGRRVTGPGRGGEDDCRGLAGIRVVGRRLSAVIFDPGWVGRWVE